MPCMSYDTNWASERTSVSMRDLKNLKEEADKLARIACLALTELEKVDPESGVLTFPSELTRWWSAHKKADEARIEKEQKEKAKIAEQKRLRKAALAKLTPEERAAFGLKG